MSGSLNQGSLGSEQVNEENNNAITNSSIEGSGILRMLLGDIGVSIIKKSNIKYFIQNQFYFKKGIYPLRPLLITVVWEGDDIPLDPLWLRFFQKCDTARGARTLDHQIKSLALFQLSYSGFFV